MYGREAIKKILPHREPFLFIDEIVQVDKNAMSIHASYTFKENEWFFKGHYPGTPIVPGVILTEAIIQVGACLPFLNKQIINKIKEMGMELSHTLPILCKIQNAVFKNSVGPGEKVEIMATSKRIFKNFILLEGQISKADKTIAQATYKAMLIASEKFLK